MTKKGMRALRRVARVHGWSESRIVEEIKRIDDAVDSFIANDPNVGECDRLWLEMAVRAPESAPILMAFHYPGLLPGQAIQ